MRCLNCNNEIDNNSKFCGYCGYKVNNINNGFNISNNQNSNIDFKTWEGACELFKSINGLSRNNCIFLGYKDPISFKNKNSNYYSEKLWNELPNYNWGRRKYRGLKNIVEMNNKGVHNLGIEYFSALLLNVTEYGIYFIPMIQYIGSNIAILTSTPKFLSANINNYIFVSNNDIESITIKKMLFRKMMRVTITISGGIVFNLIVNKKEKLIAYQESNFKYFFDMYNKKI